MSVRPSNLIDWPITNPAFFANIPEISEPAKLTLTYLGKKPSNNIAIAGPSAVL